MSALHRYYVTTLLATTTGTATDNHVIRVATPSTRRIRGLQIEVSTRGTSSTQGPIRIRVQRAATGMSAGTSPTPTPFDPGMPASLCTATTQMTGGLGAAGVVLADFNVPAVASVYTFPFDESVAGMCAVSSHLDVVTTATGDILTNIQVSFSWEE